MIFLDILSLLHKQRAGKDMQERHEIWNGIKSVYIRVVSGKCMRMHQHSNYSLPFSLNIFSCHDSGTKEVRTVSLWILDKQDEFADL